MRCLDSLIVRHATIWLGWVYTFQALQWWSSGLIFKCSTNVIGSSLVQRNEVLVVGSRSQQLVGNLLYKLKRSLNLSIYRLLLMKVDISFISTAFCLYLFFSTQVNIWAPSRIWVLSMCTPDSDRLKFFLMSGKHVFVSSEKKLNPLSMVVINMRESISFMMSTY